MADEKLSTTKPVTTPDPNAGKVLQEHKDKNPNIPITNPEDSSYVKNKKDLQDKRVEPDKNQPQAEFSQEKKETLGRIQDILNRYDGMEANIPISSEYWDMLNRYRMMK